MATKQARGTKRTCQNDECDARFYDLERSPIVCPICGGIYALAHAPIEEVLEEEAEKAAAEKAKESKSSDAENGDSDDNDDETKAVEELTDLQSDDDISDEDDSDKFLEAEEDDGNAGAVSGIVPTKPSGKAEESQ